MNKPTVYLIGAGPGDASLITVRGAELIKKADCIIYDYLVNPALLSLRKENCRVIYVGKKAGSHTLSQDNINKLLVKESKAHHVVVRLKGGDPFIFGRGAEEALYLKRRNINFEVVPGVTSAIAAPAYAGIPLTERTKTSSVGFVTGHEDPTKLESGIDWEALAKGLGTIVFLMGANNLAMIAKKLISSGRPDNTPVALVRWGTTARQKTVTGTLKNIAGIAAQEKMSPPAIVIVGDVVSLRKQLNWFERKPLFGKRIIVTRTRSQASLLSQRLVFLGAEAIEIPTIEIVSLKADRLLKEALLSGDGYDWIFFTSQNGVAEFSAFLERAGRDIRIFGNAGICAIGTQTAKSLASIGIKADYTPKEFVAEAIVKYFKQSLRNDACCPRALILRAKKARDVLPEGLKKLGFEVEVIDLYDTVIPRESATALSEALKERVDYISFTSSSTAENFIKLVGVNYRRKLSGIKLASIGPVTSKTLRKFGLKVDVEAKVYTIEGLAEAIAKAVMANA